MKNLFNLKILNESLFEKDNPLLVVIGNGGVTDQDNVMIKRADYVVRFNNYATRANIVHTEDPYRCDILFTTYDLHSHSSNPKHVVIGIPFPFKADTIVQKMDKWYPNSKHWIVNPYANMVMCRELEIKSMGYSHPIPSIGCTALWHLSKFKCRIYVGGFNWYHNKDATFQNRHLSNKARPTTVNHDYHIELSYMLKLRNSNKVMFSKACNALLDIAKEFN